MSGLRGRVKWYTSHLNSVYKRLPGLGQYQEIELTMLSHYDSLQIYSIYENDCMISQGRGLYFIDGGITF